jgi:hypothetical protein
MYFPTGLIALAMSLILTFSAAPHAETAVASVAPAAVVSAVTAPEDTLAQEADAAAAITLEGAVTDSSGAARIAGAMLVLERTDDGATRTVFADASGCYAFDALPGGTYVLNVTAEGYQPRQVTRLRFTAGTRNNVNIAMEELMDEDEKIVRMVLDAMGEDLVSRLKAADIDLSFSFGYCTSGSSAVLRYEVELRSAIGSTRYGAYNVDEALFREAQIALIDSGLFGLSEADRATLKQNLYSQKNNYADIDLACGVNMHMNHTPSDEAILYLRPSDRLPESYTKAWYSNWEWDELGFNNKP